MSHSEFDVIRRYFTDTTLQRHDVMVGVGDDAALLQHPARNHQLAVTVDTLVAGVHFPASTSAENIGYKSLAVSLSDLAAMGAEPAWMTLAITLPKVDHAWLADFSRGLFELAHSHDVQLVGGDTTRGPLSITIQLIGFVPEGQAMLRSGAKAGDGVFVTGTLGDAGAGLWLLQHPEAINRHKNIAPWLISRLERPTPRITAALAMRGLPSAAIDISDGLAADLGHLVDASGVGAEIEIDRLPLSAAFRQLDHPDGWQLAAGAGDDYELCFTASPEREAEIQTWLKALDCPCTRIGTIVTRPGIRWRDADGNPHLLLRPGYDHFATTRGA